MGMTKEDILAINDLNMIEVKVPGWGKVWLKEMHVAEREVMVGVLKEIAGEAAEISESWKVQKLYATTSALCIVDATGNKLFTLDDVPALEKKSPKSLAFIHDAAMKLSKAGTDDLEAAEKNS